jgi:Ca-activated chloride channel family protein
MEIGTAGIAAQDPVVTFKSSVDLVRVSAVVRDKKGRFVQNLTVRDFEVLDGGQPKPISDFRRDQTGVSVALLFDISGSMEGYMPTAREAGNHVISWLDARDEAAIYTFDTALEEVVPFTKGMQGLPARLTALKPFGATSLHDAIARTAERLEDRDSNRRAVVVMTDGNDTASRLTPSEVSGIASAIDVPVYILGVVSEIDNPFADLGTIPADKSPLAGALTSLAQWTGGEVFIVSKPAERSLVARQIVDELRQQYLIAFESSGRPGWHSLVVRARNKDLIVRARSGYIAGQSRPIS